MTGETRRPSPSLRWLGVAGVVLITSAAVAIGIGVALQASGGDTDAQAAEKRNFRPIVVTRSTGSYRSPRCGPKPVGRRLDNFGNALSRVDADALRRFWDWQGFRAFGVARGKKVIFRTFSYQGGLRKLRRRGGLRLRFNEVQIRGNGGTFEGVFRTRKGKKWALWGKGGWSCKRPGIIQLSVVIVREAANVARCPAPRKKAPRNAMIVCTPPRNE